MAQLLNATRFPVLRMLGKTAKELHKNRLFNVAWYPEEDKKEMDEWICKFVDFFREEYTRNIIFLNDDVGEYLENHSAIDDQKEILKFKMGWKDVGGTLVLDKDLVMRYGMHISPHPEGGDNFYMVICMVFFAGDIPFMAGVRRYYVNEESDTGYSYLTNTTKYPDRLGDELVERFGLDGIITSGNRALESVNNGQMDGFSNTIIAIYMAMQEGRADYVVAPNKTKAKDNGTPYDNYSGSDIVYIRSIRERKEGEEFEYNKDEEEEESEQSGDTGESSLKQGQFCKYRLVKPVDTIIGFSDRKFMGDRALDVVFTELTSRKSMYHQLKRVYPEASYLGVITLPVQESEDTSTLTLCNLYAICNNGVTIFESDSEKVMGLF